VTQGASAAADSLRAVLDSVFAGRDYNWVEKPDPLATLWRWFEAVRRWFTQLGDTHPLLFRLILIGLLLLVLALDAFRLLKFHPGKTPAEYGMEARLAGEAREEFRELVRKLYGYAFARRPCGPADFAAWRAQAAPERYAPTG